MIARAAGLSPIKLNVVVLKENEADISDLIDFCREKGLILQLIELLDLQHLGISGDIDAIERGLALQADRVRTRQMHRRKKYFLDGAEVEVVRPMDNTEFCANCTRLRVTSDGKIKPCLLRSDNLVEIGTCDCEKIMGKFDLIDFCRKKGLILQLIELLDLQHLGISGDIDAIERGLALQADRVRTRQMHRRKKYFLDGAEVEVVRPMDNTEFCANCTRLRVTSDGKIKPCLLRSDNLVEIGTCDCEKIKGLLQEANKRRAPYFGKDL